MRTTRRNTLQSLEHAVQLLEVLRAHPEGLGLVELCRLLELSKPSTSRILNTLVGCRYLVRREGNGKYALGVKLWELGCAAVDRETSLLEAAAPVLRRLAAETNETANLSVYDQGRIVYVDSVESQHGLKFTRGVGASVPAYCVASGKALLAFQPPEEIEAVVRTGLKAYTPKTIVSAAELKRELAFIRATGVSRNLGEYELGVGAVAVPLLDADGRALAALSIAGPLVRLTAQRMRTCEGLLRDAASELARQLAGRRRAALDEPARRRRQAR